MKLQTENRQKFTNQALEAIDGVEALTNNISVDEYLKSATAKTYLKRIKNVPALADLLLLAAKYLAIKENKMLSTSKISLYYFKDSALLNTVLANETHLYDSGLEKALVQQSLVSYLEELAPQVNEIVHMGMANPKSKQLVGIPELYVSNWVYSNLKANYEAQQAQAKKEDNREVLFGKLAKGVNDIELNVRNPKIDESYPDLAKVMGTAVSVVTKKPLEEITLYEIEKQTGLVHGRFWQLSSVNGASKKPENLHTRDLVILARYLNHNEQTLKNYLEKQDSSDSKPVSDFNRLLVNQQVPNSEAMALEVDYKVDKSKPAVAESKSLDEVNKMVDNQQKAGNNVAEDKEQQTSYDPNKLSHYLSAPEIADTHIERFTGNKLQTVLNNLMALKNTLRDQGYTNSLVGFGDSLANKMNDKDFMQKAREVLDFESDNYNPQETMDFMKQYANGELEARKQHTEASKPAVKEEVVTTPEVPETPQTPQTPVQEVEDTEKSAESDDKEMLVEAHKKQEELEQLLATAKSDNKELSDNVTTLRNALVEANQQADNYKNTALKLQDDLAEQVKNNEHLSEQLTKQTEELNDSHSKVEQLEAEKVKLEQDYTNQATELSNTLTALHLSKAKTTGDHKRIKLLENEVEDLKAKLDTQGSEPKEVPATGDNQVADNLKNLDLSDMMSQVMSSLTNQEAEPVKDQETVKPTRKLAQDVKDVVTPLVAKATVKGLELKKSYQGLDKDTKDLIKSVSLQAGLVLLASIIKTKGKK